MEKIRLGSKPPLTVRSGISIVEAARAMAARRVGAATVVEGDKVLGVVTERDVLQKVVAAGRDPAKLHVRDIMSSPAITIGMGTPVAEAAAIMRERHIRHLVVVDADGQLVAMLALRYLLYEMMDDLEREVGDLFGQIMVEDSPGG